MWVIKRCIHKLILLPLIKRDYRLRAQGKRPDRWYWADLLAVRWDTIRREDYE